MGLEAVLVDNGVMTIAALDPLDSRSLEAKVAGTAALLVAMLPSPDWQRRSLQIARWPNPLCAAH